MRASPRLAALGVALLIATPATGQGAPATPADVVAGVQACAAATTPAGVDETRLTAAGWQVGTASADGRALNTPLRFFGKPPGHAMILVGPAQSGGGRLCAVTARVATEAARNDIATAIARTYGRPVETGQNVVWRTDRHLIALNATGTDAAPAVRVGVINRPQENP